MFFHCFDIIIIIYYCLAVGKSFCCEAVEAAAPLMNRLKFRK